MSFAKRHPFVFQVIFATVKTSIADLIVQTTVEGKDFKDVDWRRNAVFVAFGGENSAVTIRPSRVNCIRAWSHCCHC